MPITAIPYNKHCMSPLDTGVFDISNRLNFETFDYFFSMQWNFQTQYSASKTAER